MYGAGSGELLDETAPVNPQTTYAECKVLVERDLGGMAGAQFAPVCLRNATAFGASPRMRFDIVLNDLCALAWTTRRIAMTSDGSPWRPLVHMEDICEAIYALPRGARGHRARARSSTSARMRRTTVCARSRRSSPRNFPAAT